MKDKLYSELQFLKEQLEVLKSDAKDDSVDDERAVAVSKVNNVIENLDSKVQSAAPGKTLGEVLREEMGEGEAFTYVAASNDGELWSEEEDEVLADRAEVVRKQVSAFAEGLDKVNDLEEPVMRYRKRKNSSFIFENKKYYSNTQMRVTSDNGRFAPLKLERFRSR